ncbi:MAG: hypothetical protein PHW18_09625 [Sulfuricurvum sp.]|uniref:hypothetical protein n=1 Tax=Sulfuricurvum sp. TaxID=2025608 RepID=UPI00260FF3CE|nr:hypothetical protein [Sulfuricurvum sp.]MDD2829818.1 hypothetical protein [Sulfuricurvum sp.]MDD4950273.1 hypothetical protein [Sulfuricurvum sp.]
MKRLSLIGVAAAIVILSGCANLVGVNDSERFAISESLKEKYFKTPEEKACVNQNLYRYKLDLEKNKLPENKRNFILLIKNDLKWMVNHYKSILEEERAKYNKLNLEFQKLTTNETIEAEKYVDVDGISAKDFFYSTKPDLSKTPKEYDKKLKYKNEVLAGERVVLDINLTDFLSYDDSTSLAWVNIPIQVIDGNAILATVEKVENINNQAPKLEGFSQAGFKVFYSYHEYNAIAILYNKEQRTPLPIIGKLFKASIPMDKKTYLFEKDFLKLRMIITSDLSSQLIRTEPYNTQVNRGVVNSDVDISHSLIVKPMKMFIVNKKNRQIYGEWIAPNSEQFKRDIKEMENSIKLSQELLQKEENSMECLNKFD